MELQIIRYENTKRALFGKLYVNSKSICDTMENHANERMEGNYAVVKQRCLQYGTAMPILRDNELTIKLLHRSAYPACCRFCNPIKEVSLNTRMPKFCPMLKPGNGVCGRVDGSILLGQRERDADILLHPVETFDFLHEMLEEAWKKEEECRIRIINLF